MAVASFWVQPMFWLYFSTWVVFTACLLVYTLRSPWQRSGVGRAMVTLYGSLVAILTMVLLFLMDVIPEGSARDFLRSLTLGCVTLAGTVQLVTILRHQRRRNERNTPLDRSAR